ncbi:hypothetical protein GCM10027406_09680 [Leifsonia lichenia]
MFGRRRHAAAVPAALAPVPPVPQLTDAQILELVHTKVAELIGEHGEWTVSRRAADDTDTIFHSVLAQSVSLSITTALVDARQRVAAGETIATAEPQHLAPETGTENGAATDAVTDADSSVVDADAATSAPADAASIANDEPAAFGWEPAPITVWTDLRKPVTGEIPTLAERSAA